MKISYIPPILNPFRRKGLVFLIVIIFSLPFGKGWGWDAKAQTWVTIPDANFVTYLQSIVPSAMSGNQLNTSSTLVTTTTQTMNGGNRSISDLSGIQYFTSLTFLGCSGNYLISPFTLPNSLTYLDCGSSYMTTLPILPSGLQTLICDNNSLASLPNLPNSITVIDCHANSLTSLPALPTSLQTLTCYSNSLTTLPSLPNSLQSIECNYNSLTTLPALPNSLFQLNCSNNNITCFPAFPNSIFYLYIEPNPYNCLPNYILPVMNSYTTTPLCGAGNTNGCPVAVASIEQVTNNKEQVTVYPNPATTSLTLTLSKGEGIADVQITDMLGNEVPIPNPSQREGNITIDVSGLSEGVYTIGVSSSEGVVNKRLVIVK